MKKNKTMMIVFLAPALFTFIIVYLYPVLRTVFMSFFKVEGATDAFSTWQFCGIGNYTKLFDMTIFRVSMMNILKIWLVGGIAVMILSLLFAVILTSGIRFKSFFRAAIYMPNVVSAVALATMWVYFVFDQRFGLFHSIFGALGLDGLAKVKWMNGDMMFWSMLIAFCFGAVGYYMLIFISGIERIPEDYYEAARIDGANKVRQFFSITLPLLKGVFKTNMTFWSVNVVAFFVWTKMWSPVSEDTATITPMVYMYNLVFGSKSIKVRDSGAGAAIGVLLALCVMIVFFVMNRLVKEEDVEF